MGREAIAHAIIGSSLGPPTRFWWTQFRRNICNISDTESDNYTGTGNGGLKSNVGYQLWPDNRHSTTIGNGSLSREITHFVLLFSSNSILMIVSLSLPDLWTVTSSGSGNGYQNLFTTQLPNDGMWVILSQHQQLDLMMRVFLCTQGPYLSLSRKQFGASSSRRWSSGKLKEATSSNRNSSCVCVFQDDNVISILIDCFSIDLKTALKHYKQIYCLIIPPCSSL